MYIPETDPCAPALDELRRLRRARELIPQEARRLAQHAAALFRARYMEDGAFLPDAVTLLTELAIDPDTELGGIGAGYLFPELVEWSADWFDPAYCDLYDRLFAQVIDICRHLPQTRELHFSLYGYGIHDIEGILARREVQRAPRPPFDPGADRVKKILIPSRVTFGAEVAVTSVIARAMGWLYPDAECVILGAPAVGQLFAGEARVRVEDVGYPRRGTLLDRLCSWLSLIQVVADELAGLDLNEYLIIDPDSRLTQLGLMPLTTDNSRALFFESRRYGGDELPQPLPRESAGLTPDAHPVVDLDAQLTRFGRLPLTGEDARALYFERQRSGRAEDPVVVGDAALAPAARIGALTARWLAERFKGLGEDDCEALLPFVSLSDVHNTLTGVLQRAIKAPADDAARPRPVVCVSFGVGGNEAKRVGEDFEHGLLRALVEAGARVLFAKGVGDEILRAERHLGRLNAVGGVAIAEAEANAAADLPPADELRAADVIAWKGELGAFCALIAASDLYVGYDSAGQHIAAALGVPVIDVFADDSIPMVTTRWTPTGPAPVHVIEHYKAPGETLVGVMAAYRATVDADNIT